jgi:hypothetical protein
MAARQQRDQSLIDNFILPENNLSDGSADLGYAGAERLGR